VGVLAGWDVRQAHTHPDIGLCNGAIRQDLANGVTSVLLSFDRAGRLGLDSDASSQPDAPGDGGVMISTADDLSALLEGVDLGSVGVALDAGGAFLPAAAMLKAVWRTRGIAPDEARGAFGADPLAALVVDGYLPVSEEAALAQMAALACVTADELPNVRAVGVDATPYHEAGATEAQELACGLATGVAYLRALEAAGMTAGDALAQMTLVHAVDADLFLSIAKLRASRRLWARVAEACGAPEAGGRIALNARSSRRMMARRDPWVNMLRTTVSCFAAAVAGADSIGTLPFDAALGIPDTFARRIARNTQLVLRDESSLHRVIDPAGGAWALESIANALAGKAWAAFQEIEAAGGMAAVIGNGTLAARINAKWRQRARRLAHREEPLTGVSDFPDLQEQPVRTAPVDMDVLRADAAARLSRYRSAHEIGRSVAAIRAAAETGGPALVRAIDSAAADGATIAALAGAASAGAPAAAMPLPRRRLGEAFEALRDRSDTLAAKTGQRPRAFLAVIGDLAQYGARSAFARNALAAAGIDSVSGAGGTDAAATADAFGASEAGVCVLCSTDANYASHAAEWVAALRAAGAGMVLLAGTKGALGGDACGAAAEIDAFMHRECDMLGVLTDVVNHIEGGSG